MYAIKDASQNEGSVEEICYEQEHIDEVLEIIKNTFSRYFVDFLAYEGMAGLTEHDVQKIANSLGVESNPKKKSKDKTQSYKNILIQGLDAFEKDRQKYLDIFDGETLEEYQDDPSAFKGTSKNTQSNRLCYVIIHSYHNE